MKAAHCERSWQVQAARDGRLDARAQLALAQHLQSCATCQAERRGLEELALGLRNLAHEVDEVAMRRLRQRTMEAASLAVLEGSAPRGKRATRLWALAAVVAAAAALLLFWRRDASKESASAVVVYPLHQAKWKRNVSGNAEFIELSSGTLLFRVARSARDPRLVVRVPDGEIEDLGTVFSVTVADGKTREIVVREGRVLFHRPGAPALHLVAGSSWTAPVATLPLETVPPPEPGVTNAEQESPPMKRSEPHRQHAQAASHAPASSPASDDEALEDISRREDEAYLHIIALLREGRSDEARLVAFAYLRAFPAGFRRAEVSRVAGAPVPPEPAKR